ncbi:energy-coupling factor transporter transmembrane protein EcfT [Clostridium sporogenes]|uniref:energy-coupling factor transporter transmembrane component T family protein n=1 Tax=Clostridium sporogenes TaxID=1509 RepID=UPI0013CF5921|nr:energy-coupling factor transporter transmembrane component T [Clostridium sporogenes]EJE7236187.1 energy-coupling factor transporter transmembrane protein EcfT [Clostridium botulinum]NFE79701.1 energy-coupling factor transporter transmembrane protein EcfT [Clostridium sporogenes]NFG68188.1 energy-coupling factor transporter transmembrane protein EcfT [Clostridium sporogenes]
MKLEFDFRAKIIILFLDMCLVAILKSNIIIYSMLFILTIYLIIQGYLKSAIKLFLIAVVVIILKILSMGQGITILLPDMFLFMIIRIISMVMAAKPIIAMPPGEAVAVFKKMRVPDSFALPVTFMLRFIPTVRSEFQSVFSAMRLRGLLSWCHPIRSIEYIFVPIMIRSSKVADELAASAEARGIACPGNHTCRRDISFKRKDRILCVVGVMVTALLLIWGKMGMI